MDATKKNGCGVYCGATTAEGASRAHRRDATVADEIRAAGAEAGEAYAAEYPGEPIDGEWLGTAYEYDAVNRAWPDGSYEREYEPAARAAVARSHARRDEDDPGPGVGY